MEQQPQISQPVEGEHDWIFDCLITFLKSPRWKTPVVSFIEEHCLVFDNEEENKLEYTTIHMSFYKMVDELLCELVAEMGITREQFQAACETSASNPTHHRIVQQILNVDDFEAFKKMMIKKNMQINEFALQELMKKSSNAPQIEEEQKVPEATPVTQAATSAPAQGNDAGAEDEQMRLILEMSRVASEEADKAAQEEEEMIRQAIEASQQEEQQRLVLLKREETLTEQAMAASSSPNVSAAAAVKEEVKQPEQPEMVSPQDMPVAVSPTKAQRIKVEAKIDPEQQRKEEEKLKQLAEFKRKREEEKKNPPPKFIAAAPVKAAEQPKAQEEPKIDPKKFLVEQKEVINKIRKPNVEEVSAFDDAFTGGIVSLRPAAEDPYAGKSFAEVLRIKREKLEADLKSSKIADEPVQAAAAATEEAKPEPVPAPTGKDESLEARKQRLQAQRAALLEKRKQQREQELNDYNKSSSGAQLDAARNSFYAQMIKMDKALPQGAQPPSIAATSSVAAGESSQALPAMQPKAARSGFNLDDLDAVDI